MENGENWEGEHYFGYLDTVSHLNDPPRKAAHVPAAKKEKIPPVLERIMIGLIIFDIIGFIFLLIVGA